MIASNKHFLLIGNLLAQSYAASALGMDADELLNDINIYDFVPQSMSAFARLLVEKESMMAWNEFLAATDEQQDIFLAAMGEEDADWLPARRSKKNRNRKDTKSSAKVDLKNEEESDDQEKHVHPAFCPKRSFQRIDSELKSLLRRKHIPMVWHFRLRA